jgi:hypothetical protein
MSNSGTVCGPLIQFSFSKACRAWVSATSVWAFSWAKELVAAHSRITIVRSMTIVNAFHLSDKIYATS